jgi:hypothetical protein
MTDSLTSGRKRFQLQFGAFAPTLREQLIAAGFELKSPITKSSAALTHLQIDAEAVARLRIRGRITESMAVSAEKKIVKEVGQLLRVTP